jgi:hypothetical protein
LAAAAAEAEAVVQAAAEVEAEAPKEAPAVVQPGCSRGEAWLRKWKKKVGENRLE